METRWEDVVRESQPLEQNVAHDIEKFVSNALSSDRPLAVVTSGGTTVPIDGVRFIDNFSTGNRGAACAEYFLATGYSVVFLHRANSRIPFLRNIKMNDSLLETASSELAWNALRNSLPEPETLKRLHIVSFESISEYLLLLRLVCQAVSPAGTRAVIILAAAVSDFFIPPHKLSQHKIQSSAGGLTLSLENVPKCLGFIKKQPDPTSPIPEPWAPDALVVSFKLETNPNILEAKAASAIAKYGVDLVVANQLGTHTETVSIVQPNGTPIVLPEQILGDETEKVKVGGTHVTTIQRNEEKDIETLLVSQLSLIHQEHINKGQESSIKRQKR